MKRRRGAIPPSPPMILLATLRCLPFSLRMKPGRVLLEAGAAGCSDAELLAILLGSGGRGYSALDSATALLDKYGTLAGLMNRPWTKLRKFAASRSCARFGWPLPMKSAKNC